MLPSLWSAYPDKLVGSGEGSFVYVQSTSNDRMRIGAWLNDEGAATYVTLHISGSGNGAMHLLYDHGNWGRYPYGKNNG